MYTVILWYSFLVQSPPPAGCTYTKPVNGQYVNGTAEHCCICIPGRACVERFVDLHAAQGGNCHFMTAPPPFVRGGDRPDKTGEIARGGGGSLNQKKKKIPFPDQCVVLARGRRGHTPRLPTQRFGTNPDRQPAGARMDASHASPIGMDASRYVPRPLVRGGGGGTRGSKQHLRHRSKMTAAGSGPRRSAS